MELKFISDFGVQDFENVDITFQENNSRTSDALFSKFTFPFDHYADAEFLKQYGDYKSYEASNLQNKIPGQFLYEGKIYDADLFIQTVEGSKVTQQIDFGIDGLPNFDKKLSELPLEKFAVTDIYAFARTICEKQWPLTNFNFPRIYTTKYPTSTEVWKNFDGYINDLKKDGTEMRRNYIDDSGQIFNVNILHPCPHPLYLLIAGFRDADLTLGGDILTDPNLQQKWVFSSTQYFSSLTQVRTGLNVSALDYYDQPKNHAGNTYGGFYDKSLSVAKAGSYKILGHIILRQSNKLMKYVSCDLYLNGVKIWGVYGKNDFNEDFNLDINITQDNSVLNWKGRSVFELGESFNVLEMQLIGDALDDSDQPGEDLGVITNLNEIDLSRAVPDMTFGEYFNVFKNWFNYDIDIVNKTVLMNRIADAEVSGVKDFTFLEAPTPKRTLLNKKSFSLQFPDLGENKKDSMYYDIAGARLNGAVKSDTNIIQINGYLMPLKRPKAGGYNTANVLKDDTNIVALVEYAGIRDGQNNATYSTGCDFPELFKNNWEPWLRIRINGQEYSWTKNCSIEKLSQYSIKDYIFCYQNIHIIKSISKDKIGPDLYKIDFVTETVV